MLPLDAQEWFHLVMEHAEPYVVPHVSYRGVSDGLTIVEQTVKVEVVWPRDVLAYRVDVA
jgi:hypothetical protein